MTIEYVEHTTLEDDLETLFDVLPCATHAEIAERTGWTTGKVARILGRIRNPEVSAEWGWTVPHAPRGTGEHLYQVVLLDEPQNFTSDEVIAFKEGAHSTLSVIATQGENEAHALRQVAMHLPRERQRLNRVARALSGAAAMAEEARERIANDLP